MGESASKRAWQGALRALLALALALPAAGLGAAAAPAERAWAAASIDDIHAVEYGGKITTKERYFKDSAGGSCFSELDLSDPDPDDKHDGWKSEESDTKDIYVITASLKDGKFNVSGSFSVRYRNAYADASGSVADLVLTLSDPKVVKAGKTKSGDRIEVAAYTQGNFWMSSYYKESTRSDGMKISVAARIKLVEAGTDTAFKLPATSSLTQVFTDIDQFDAHGESVALNSSGTAVIAASGTSKTARTSL